MAGLIVGVPKEVKDKEGRVSVQPDGVSELAYNGWRSSCRPTPGWAPGSPTTSTSRLVPAFSPPRGSPSSRGRAAHPVRRDTNQVRGPGHPAVGGPGRGAARGIICGCGIQGSSSSSGRRSDLLADSGLKSVGESPMSGDVPASQDGPRWSRTGLALFIERAISHAF
jgi:hypothetical protein